MALVEGGDGSRETVWRGGAVIFQHGQRSRQSCARTKAEQTVPLPPWQTRCQTCCVLSRWLMKPPALVVYFVSVTVKGPNAVKGRRDRLLVGGSHCSHTTLHTLTIPIMSSLLEEYHPAQVPTPPAIGDEAPRPLPIPTYTDSRAPEGTEATLVVETYDDRILVLVSQMDGKIGCLVGCLRPAPETSPLMPSLQRLQTQATLPSSIPLLRPPRPDPSTSPTTTPPSILSMLPPPHPSTALTPLLGAPPDPIVNDTYVAQIATLVWMLCETAAGAVPGAGRRGVIVGLALREGTEAEEEEEGEVERRRFAQVMELVGGWPGLPSQ